MMNVDEFLDAVPDEGRRQDARRLCALMREITGEPPAMWASGVVGFGRYHYRYATGREGDAPLVGLSPRKANLVVYLQSGFEDESPALVRRLGRVKTGQGCLYLKRLDEVDPGALRELIDRSARAHKDMDTQ
jgi:hypothetical protein